MAAGDYLVEVDETGVVTGLVLTTGANPIAVTGLAAGTDYDLADFGYWDPGTASIGDRVFGDEDGSGVLNGGEVGLDGVTVNLYADINTVGVLDGESVLATRVTAGGGAYDFTGLAAGDYLVEVDETTIPTGFVLTTVTNRIAVALSAGEDFNDADFGFFLDPVPVVGLAPVLDDRLVVAEPLGVGLAGDVSFEFWVNPVDSLVRRNPLAKAFGGRGRLRRRPMVG